MPDRLIVSDAMRLCDEIAGLRRFCNTEDDVQALVLLLPWLLHPVPEVVDMIRAKVIEIVSAG